MGDFNLNLLNHQIHDATGQFLDGLHSCMFSRLITLPFRITSHSATLIDNIFTNYLDHHYRTAGLLLADISDHLPIFSICSDDISSLRPKENIFVRNKNEANTLNFLQQLRVRFFGRIQDWIFDPRSRGFVATKETKNPKVDFFRGVTLVTKPACSSRAWRYFQNGGELHFDFRTFRRSPC